MEIKDKIRENLKSGNLEGLNSYRDTALGNLLLEILSEDISSFSYEKKENIDYLDTLIKLLPKYIKRNSKKGKTDERLKEIHQKIKTFLVQKPGYIEKTNHNYKMLKNMINEIEVIQMSILYDYIDKYKGSIYELINFIIFEHKDIAVFNDALNRFPFLVNYFDKDNKNLIVSVTDEYIKEVLNYTESRGIDNIIYYDQVINNILKSKRFRFDVIDKQTILKNVKDALLNIDDEKARKTFYLNTLIEKLNGNEVKEDMSFLTYKYNIKTDFDAAIKSETRKIISNYSIDKSRTSVDDYILSFDGEDAKEIDDALSIKILDNGNIILGVHIADPTDLIDENSIIFEEAAARTTSIYLSDKSYSMFPEELGTNLISLLEKKSRPAISYYFEFDKNGILINSNYLKSIIEVNKNLTYDDFNRILLMNGDDKLKNSIDNLSYISSILQRYYNVDPLYKTVNRESKNITSTNIVGSSNGEKVVESSMIFTNQMVSKYFYDNNLPFIFRNHNINKSELAKLDKLKYKIQEENNSEEYLRYIEMVKNLYPKAKYDIECKGHEGLGIKYYSHITSPLRRMADVIGLICLEKLYFNSPTEENKKMVRKLVLKHSKSINDKRNSIEKFSSEYEELVA